VLCTWGESASEFFRVGICPCRGVVRVDVCPKGSNLSTIITVYAHQSKEQADNKPHPYPPSTHPDTLSKVWRDPR
jgi:hypothetical protein